MARTMQLLNSLGHVSVTWEERNDAQVLPVIQDMIDKGFRFFILKDDPTTATMQEVTVSNISEVAESRVILIHDDMLQQLHDAGLLQVGGEIDDDAETTGVVAESAEQVAEHDTVVTPPARGG